MLNPSMLADIDTLFDKAEMYFNKKQSYIQGQLENASNPKRFDSVKSRVDTNLPPIG